MRNELLVRFGIIAVVIALAAYFAFPVTKTKLGLDLKGGVYVVLEAVDTESVKVDEEAMNKLVEVMDRRINGLGVAEPTIQRAGERRVVIELPGLKNAEEAIATIGKTAMLEFKLYNDDGTLGETVLTGKELKSADIGFSQFGKPEISFELTNEGAKTFGKITRENVGKKLAITLDGQEQTAPVIQSEIPGGKGVINGSYTVEEAKKLAMLLNAGALPVKVDIKETRTVGASLGELSIQKSFYAGVIALIGIAVFMLIFYRLPGIVANLSLLIYAVVVLGVQNFFEVTLTLPGIAGFILSMGMAVDANVIIFARMKEELKLGTGVLGALDAGFNKAFVAIFDSNVTTLLITGVLFAMGSGPIKGFAVTLTIGILVSMFTAIMVTKVLLKAFIVIFKIENPVLFGVRR